VRKIGITIALAITLIGCSFNQIKKGQVLQKIYKPPCQEVRLHMGYVFNSINPSTVFTPIAVNVPEKYIICIQKEGSQKIWDVEVTQELYDSLKTGVYIGCDKYGCWEE